ncbi:tetratricopeptide repeat protein [Aquifex sp.]
MREFVDKEREAAKKLPQVIRKYKFNIPMLIKALKELIEEDPYYLETYVFLAEIMENEGNFKEAERILLEAYERAMELIKDEEGKLPDRLEWKHPTNRHIIKALVEAGVMLWEVGELDRALEIFKTIYRLNPADEPGVRYYILGILENMDFEEFESVFTKEGEYDKKSLENWFNRKKEKFESFIRA